MCLSLGTELNMEKEGVGWDGGGMSFFFLFSFFPPWRGSLKLRSPLLN